MNNSKTITLVCITLMIVFSNVSFAQKPFHNRGEFIQNIPPMRERVEIMERWWKWKKEHVLPAIMREQNVDMWIIRNNEAELYYNNEGPVYTSLIPANDEGMTLPGIHEPPGSQWTPRYMIYHDKGNKIEYLEPRDYEHITDLVNDRDPDTIAISQFDNEDMITALGRKYSARTVDSKTLSMRWLETMSPEQIRVYKFVQGVANDIIAEGFSNKTVIPDVTTTNDLDWWFRHRMLDLNIEHENHPTIRVQRRPADIEKYETPSEKFFNGRTGNGVDLVIRRGDIIGCDKDIMLLGLVTDTKAFAYVLRENERDVPNDLEEALRKVNRLHADFAKEFQYQRTGIEIVNATNIIPLEEGIITTTIVFHPPPMFIRRYLEGGYMFSHKIYVAGLTSTSDYYSTSIVSNSHSLHYNTLYSFDPEPTRVSVEDWGENGVDLTLGQIVAFTEEGLAYLGNPVAEWHVIR